MMREKTCKLRMLSRSSKPGIEKLLFNYLIITFICRDRKLSTFSSTGKDLIEALSTRPKHQEGITVVNI